MMRLRYLLPVALFVVLAGFLAAGLKLDPREVPSPLIGRPAPDFRLPRLHDGQAPLARADLLGQVWILNVWASWCSACREEHPTLVAFSKRHPVAVIGLNYKDQRPEALAWLARHGNPYQASLFDADGRLGIDFGVYGVPETFVMDRQGVVRFKHIGPLTEHVIQERLEPLLKALNA